MLGEILATSLSSCALPERVDDVVLTFPLLGSNSAAAESVPEQGRKALHAPAQTGGGMGARLRFAISVQDAGIVHGEVSRESRRQGRPFSGERKN